jgi:hypothetical protein
MKKLRTTLLKGLLVITLFTGVSVGLSTSGIKALNEAHASVSEQQVYSYLVGLGYTVVTLNPKQGTQYDWIAHTILNGVDYWTTVHCNSASIIGHDDILF